MSEELTFPILDMKEIIWSLNELDIKVKAEDLKQPTTNFVCLVYKQLLNLISPQNILNTEDDLLKESFQLFGFFKQLAKITTDCGCFISTRDVFNPTPKRTKYILSALINFCKFREDKIVLFEQYSENTENLLQEKIRLESLVSEKQEKLNIIKQQRLSEQPKLDSLRSETSALTQTLRQLKQTQEVMSEKIDKLKVAKSNVTENITNNSFLINNLKQDLARLQSRIVSDPEKLKQAINDMSNSVKNDKMSIVQTERKLRELETKYKAMSICEGDLIELCSVLEEAKLERSKLQDITEKLTKERDNGKKKDDLLRELGITAQQYERQVKGAEEKLKRLEMHKMQRLRQNKDKMDALRQKNNELKLEHTECLKKQQEIDLKCFEMEQQIEQTENEVESEKLRLNAGHKRLMTEMDKYQDAIGRALKI